MKLLSPGEHAERHDTIIPSCSFEHSSETICGALESEHGRSRSIKNDDTIGEWQACTSIIAIVVQY
jgi:hypothetical protein